MAVELHCFAVALFLVFITGSVIAFSGDTLTIPGIGFGVVGILPLMLIGTLALVSVILLPLGLFIWNIGMGYDDGDVAKDEEGIGTMKALGQNMAWLLKKLNS
jgi:hypothetical protein